MAEVRLAKIFVSISYPNPRKDRGGGGGGGGGVDPLGIRRIKFAENVNYSSGKSLLLFFYSKDFY